MITGESRRDDLPSKRERAEEVFLEHDPVAALTDAFDALLRARGLELIYLTHAEVRIPAKVITCSGESDQPLGA